MEIRDAISVTTAFQPSDTTLKRHCISLVELSSTRGGGQKKKKKKKERYMKSLETGKEIHRDCNFKYRIDFLSLSILSSFFSHK